MAVREVLKMGHPTLRVKANPIPLEEIQSREFRNLIQDMFETMEKEEGIGIAAPQIGISKQVAIVGVPKDNPRYPETPESEEDDDFDILVVINPKVTVMDETPSGFWEGCLSVPGLRGYVERPSKIKVEFTDLEGEAQVMEVSGFGATVFQHELDHLDGVLYVDRVSDITKLSYMEEYLEFHDDLDDDPDSYDDSDEEEEN
jgi:peptide deformylase